MPRTYSVGDEVICCYYNLPDRRHYGSLFYGQIVDIDMKRYDIHFHGRGDVRGFLIQREDREDPVWVHRKEIIRRIPKGKK